MRDLGMGGNTNSNCTWYSLTERVNVSLTGGAEGQKSRAAGRRAARGGRSKYHYPERMVVLCGPHLSCSGSTFNNIATVPSPPSSGAPCSPEAIAPAPSLRAAVPRPQEAPMAFKGEGREVRMGVQSGWAMFREWEREGGRGSLKQTLATDCYQSKRPGEPFWLLRGVLCGHGDAHVGSAAFGRRRHKGRTMVVGGSGGGSDGDTVVV